MTAVTTWCDENRMAKNAEKTKCMLITTYQKLYRLPVKELEVTIENMQLKNIQHEKLLGVVIDQHLCWKQHVDKVHRTVSMLLARFRQIKPFLPTDARVKYVKAFIFPHFDYCCTIWGSANVEKLYKLQKRAAWMIYDRPTRTPTEPLFRKLNWMTIMDRIDFRKVQMVYKSLNGLAPTYMKDMFKFVHEVSSAITRSSLYRSQIYLTKSKKSFKGIHQIFQIFQCYVMEQSPRKYQEC